MRQILFFILVLFVGVFIGINLVEKNMHEMQGTVGAPRAIQVTPVDGKIQIAVLGQNVSTGSIDQQKIETVKQTVSEGSNFLSMMGHYVGAGIRYATRELLDFVFNWFH